MLTLEKPLKTKKDNNQVCWYESNTRICGKIKNVDYFERVESKMLAEPFYGDIDLFGF